MKSNFFYCKEKYIFLINCNHRITKGGVPNQCSWLNGTLSVTKDELGRKVESIPFKYMLTEGPTVKKSNGASGAAAATMGKDTKSKLDEFNEGLRDFKNNMLPKLGKCIRRDIDGTAGDPPSLERARGNGLRQSTPLRVGFKI